MRTARYLACLAALAAGAPFTAAAEELPRVTAPVAGEPSDMQSPGDAVYVHTRSGLVTLPDGKPAITPRPPSGFGLGTVRCAAGPAGAAACLYTAGKEVGSEKRPRTLVRLVYADARGQTTLGEGVSQDGFSAGIDGLYVGPQGATFAWTLTQRVGKDLVTTSRLSHGGQTRPVKWPSASTASSLVRLGGGGRTDPRVQFYALGGQLRALVREDNGLVTRPVDADPQAPWHSVATSSLYDVRPVVGDDGWAYVFYHEPTESVTRVATSRDGASWTSQPLDTKESGWQLEAAVHGRRVVAAWYYFRNTYNKGLRVAMLEGGKVVEPAFGVVRVEAHNTGWHPRLGIAGDGTTWLTWWHDVDQEIRVWSRLERPADLTRYRTQETGDSTDEYKDWYLQAGAGAWYTWWTVHELELDSKDDADGQKIGTAEHALANTLLLATAFEARYKSVQLALSYAQSIVDDANERTGGKLESFTGSIKLDELFPGHDFKVRTVWGRYTGHAKPGSDADLDGRGEQRVETDYIDAQALALNKWRMKYGLSYSRYRLPLSVHTWFAPEGEKEYAYSGSYFREAQMDEIRALVGYDTLDYAAKYENSYNGFIIDGEIVGGVALVKFDEVPVGPDGDTKSDATLASFGARLDLGWLFMKRFRGAAGLGFYLRPVYRGDFGFVGPGGKPGERDEDETEESDPSARLAFISYRHGPWLDTGVVW